MNKDEAYRLYSWQSTSWPLVIKPGLPERYVTAKVDEILETFGAYSFDEVLAAFQEYKSGNPRYPFTSEILELIRQNRQQRVGSTADDELYEMEFVEPSGHEYCIGLFKRDDFINHPANPERLTPREWRRRFMAERHHYYISQQQIKNGQRKAGEV